MYFSSTNEVKIYCVTCYRQFLRYLIKIIDSYNHAEGQLNDQFTQLGLNNGPSLPPVQNNSYVIKTLFIIFNNLYAFDTINN